jgi:hypothetical protein
MSSAGKEEGDIYIPNITLKNKYDWKGMWDRTGEVSITEVSVTNHEKLR